MHHCYGLVYCILSNHPLQALCTGTFQFFSLSFQFYVLFTSQD
jgi:hypothetical protein